MKISGLFLLLAIVCFFASSEVFSQVQDTNETVTLNGVKFLIYQVKSGETLYSLCKKHNITDEELKNYNPGLSGGFKAGMILHIPLTEKKAVAAGNPIKPSDPDSFIIHVIGKQETLYFVSRKYGITVEEIYRYNPGLKKFEKGKKIQIPQWKKNSKPGEVIPVKDEKADETEVLADYKVKHGETLYSISKNKGIGIPEILFYNPEAKNLKEGAILKLPSGGEKRGGVASGLNNTGNGNILHIVESGETLFGLTQKYNVTKDELIALNPDIEKKLQAGSVIKVPLNDVYKSEIRENTENQELSRHTVKKGETLNSLSDELKIGVVEIKKFNPALNFRGLVEGEVLFLPAAGGEEKITRLAAVPDSAKKIPVIAEKMGPVTRIPKTCQRSGNGKKGDNLIQIAMFLPLFLDENEEVNEEIDRITATADTIVLTEKKDSVSDTLSRELNNPGFYKNSENFLCFYEGALIAIDSLRKSGIQVSLSVYDTRQDASVIRKIIATEKLKEADLIIGPVFPEQQADLSAYASKNRVPMVSPLASASGFIKSNPYFFQVNPTRDYLYAQTADLIAREYSASNFIVLKIGSYEKTPEGALVEMINEKMTNAGYYSNSNHLNFKVYDLGKNGYGGLKGLLSQAKENVLLITTMNEGVISETLANLKYLSSAYDITLIGNKWYPQLKSIDQENFHLLKLKYLSPYWINYNSSSTVNFIRCFRNLFKTEPDEFGFQGFDVTYFFCDVIANYGKDFYRCLNYINGDLTQGKYHFNKIFEFGGYMNQGLSVISFEPDYSVVCRKIIGQPVLVER